MQRPLAVCPTVESPPAPAPSSASLAPATRAFRPRLHPRPRHPLLNHHARQLAATVPAIGPRNPPRAGGCAGARARGRASRPSRRVRRRAGGRARGRVGRRANARAERHLFLAPPLQAQQASRPNCLRDGRSVPSSPPSLPPSLPPSHKDSKVFAVEEDASQFIDWAAHKRYLPYSAHWQPSTLSHCV